MPSLPSNLERLSREYRKTIPEKLKLMQFYVDSMRPAIQKEFLMLLKLEVHKMAGTAGSFGFLQVSEVCKAFEIDLHEKIQQFSTPNANEPWIADFDLYLEKIRKGFFNESRN